MPELQPRIPIARAPELDPDTPLARFETNHAAQRGLQPDLKTIDLKLQWWASWARPTLSYLGYPRRSVTERVNEGGILARTPGLPHSPEWPVEVVELDRLVAKLPSRQMAAVFATYFHLALPCEARAVIYVRWLHHLARTRSPPVLPNRSQRAPDTAGPRAFKDDLDRARWSLRFGLLQGRSSA